MKVTLIHAYSATNSGDLLLVDEAVELVREAIPGATISLVATDPPSFEGRDFESVIHALSGKESSMGAPETLLRGAYAVLTGRVSAGFEALMEESDIVLGVGGGYLRAKSVKQAIKLACTNLIQVPRRSGSAIPFIYLPQSVGPLNFSTRKVIVKRLKEMNMVLVRDDRSLRDLASLNNVARFPDMALLGLPSELRNSQPDGAVGTGPVGLVARALPGSSQRVSRYKHNIIGIHSALAAEPLAQATSRGNNDPEFYGRLGFVGPFRRLADAVHPSAPERAPVVVSVRLHGSIQAIRRGVPSVHLSYERKGWGAYHDLGLGEYVHNALDFDRDEVIEQVRRLQADPADYWARVGLATTRLEESRRVLVDQVATIARRSRVHSGASEI